MNPRRQKILDLEKERDRYIVESDYWHSCMDKFWLDNRIVYHVPENIDCKADSSYFSWDDYPEQRDFFFPIIEHYGVIIDSLNHQAFMLKYGLTELQRYDLYPSWEDKFLDDWENIMTG